MDFVELEGGEGHLQHTGSLIVPALSMGNAGQLAVDLLISHGACKSGYLDEPHVLPCVGNDPFGPSANGDLAVALEVYEDAELNASIIQQRSPVIKGTMMKFSKNLATWAAQEGVKEVIILSGLDSGKVQRSETNAMQLQYISTANEDGSDDRCEQLGWKRLHHYLPSSEAWQVLDHQAMSAEDSLYSEIPQSDDLYFPRQPFASLLACCKAQGLKVVCILCFCAEGDNVPDAFLIADGLHRLLCHEKKEPQGSGVTWKIPLSWTTVYGPPPDDTMFC
ncbi:uncharacterized protein [Physcomitrium patens]|uniref:Proteasome assembly chaperone 2 n=1 Tax=Physcomitrium patens TaxID=3218 RepID=A0A2K1L2N2_PHYPA|nr:proteasome assembly chaperone 2-like [Physcomitrium patens]XP_024368228.1 proteasome assembly chaperone 2-like [Physcomitrium patens]PNR60284.1 hypothetical protein PHYPA_003077 [Physcomitrium patens]|eukprot:XP_024368227.1 proteasome assembly chaperone 2-like [Physcomitrella patens]